MKAHTTPIAGALGLAAALAFSSPAAAASTAPAPVAPMTGITLSLADSFSSNPVKTGIHTSDWRRCGLFGCRRGFRRGWRGRGWRGRRRGIGIGGVIAGAAVIGGIAVIASAANNNRRRDRDVVVVERDRRDDDRRFDDRRRSNPRSSGSSGLDSAVNQCTREIERDVRIDSVDGATRVSSGWVVTGSIFDGSGFTCEIGNDGRISDVQYGRFRGSSVGNAGGDRAAAGQWSDDRYASARASMNGQYNTYSTAERFADAGTAQRERPAEPLVPLTSDRLPAYPGGPLPGEDGGQ